MPTGSTATQGWSGAPALLAERVTTRKRKTTPDRRADAAEAVAAAARQRARERAGAAELPRKSGPTKRQGSSR